MPAGVILLRRGLSHPVPRRQPRHLPPAGESTSRSTGELVPHPVRRLVPADHHSTAAERQECRARLGATYDAQLVAVADSLARRPAALRAIAMDPHELPIDDLVTVSAYLNGPPIGLDRALRKGTAEVHRAVIACLVSGLRRFPAHHGPCYGVARAVGVPLDVYIPGRTVIEPAFIRADPQWSPEWSAGAVADDTEIVFAFWSRTGRQVGALGTGGTRGAGAVVFVAGTRFRVLGVQTGSASAGPGVVFLSECPKSTGLAGLGLRIRLELGKPRSLIQLRRQMNVPAETGGIDLRPTRVLGFTPGFDPTGRPYQEELTQHQDRRGQHQEEPGHPDQPPPL